MGGGRGNELGLPHPLAAVAAVLLENTRACRLKPHRKLFAECCGGAIDMGVRTPTKMLRAMKNFLHAHLEDHVGMGANPDSPGRDVPQHRIERNPVLPLGYRINPDEHAVELQKLFPHLVRYFVCIDRGFRGNAERGQLFEDAIEPIVLRCRVTARLAIAAPKQRQLAASASVISIPAA
jgi:hypothetical protein